MLRIMGGGDLNLKKSWHPNTMKNQERVWKAEQAKNKEDQKLQELRKEIDEEKNREELHRIGESSGVLPKTDRDKKLEWMYKNGADLINREEYLLGRAIDKSFEVLQAEEAQSDSQMIGVKQPLNHVEHECIPLSLRAYRNVDTTEQVDLQRKVMEDPLMLIRQREIESRRRLLENPVKLKELHRILKTDQLLKKEKKTKKSKKKGKKRTKSTTDSSSESSDIDKELEKHYKKLKQSLSEKEEAAAGINLSKLLDSKYETISKELDRAMRAKKKIKHSRKRSPSRDTVETKYSGNRDRQNSRHLHERSTPRERRIYHSSKERKTTVEPTQRQRTRSPHRNIRNSSSSSREYKNQFRTYSAKIDRDAKQSDRGRRRSSSQSYKKAEKRSNPDYAKRQADGLAASKDQTTSGNIKLNDEAREARLREMMSNAAWREADRTKTVQKHRAAYALEEQQHKNRDFDKHFINNEVKKAIDNHTSVGSRIRSNLNNIQRTSSAMNRNFAKK